MSTELSRYPIHLGRGGTAVAEPEFTGMEWYAGYLQRHASDGAEGRLVSMFSFDAPWDGWEMHPRGHEVVICTAGEITLVQEIDGKEVRTVLRPGECAINPPGVWHTADVSGRATAVFITAGYDTRGRPRAATQEERHP
jgi:mannose-6-phosphate isomerase-like protein (cupin superfamily)